MNVICKICFRVFDKEIQLYLHLDHVHNFKRRKSYEPTLRDLV